MPGMNTGLNANDPAVIAAFKAVLLHQGLIALLIFGTLGLAWVSIRAWLPAAASDGPGTKTGTPAPAVAEPAWRLLLRTGFGILWLLDGILQAQPQMAIGLPSQVIEPTAVSSPPWVQHVVNWAGTSWSYHPLQAGAAAVWIQAGIGIWMHAAVRGPLSRLAGLASAAWGLVVWVFGESFGGIFAPGLTWLFGAPGAVLIYVVAGALIALPERAWRTRRLGWLTVAGFGVFLTGMAVLQAWPGRGFWQGTAHGQPGTLAGMTQSMAPTPQPHFLSAWVSAFTAFDQAHGFAVNLFAVVGLAVIGALFLSGQPRLIRPAVIAFTVLCLADWVLIEDIGAFGGLGTDPNSMIPMALLAAAGYLALTRAPAPAAEPASPAVPAGGWAGRLRAAAAQHGRNVTLASLHGKVALLTFLDDTCTTTCPLEAQEFRLAGQLLGTQARHVELVAINANPVDYQLGYIRAFDRQERLGGIPNWLYLTGSPAQLRPVWARYGVTAQILPAGSMIGHSEIAFVIDQNGHVRQEMNFDPGPGTAATQSSFAAELADAARQLLGRP